MATSTELPSLPLLWRLLAVSCFFCCPSVHGCALSRSDYNLYGSLCALYLPLAELTALGGSGIGDSNPLLTFAAAQSLCRSRDGDLLSSDSDLAALWLSSSAMGATVWLGLTGTASGGYRWLSGGRPFGLDRRVYWERNGALPAVASSDSCVALYTAAGLRVLLPQANCSSHQPAIDGLLCRYDPLRERNRRGRYAQLIGTGGTGGSPLSSVAVLAGRALGRIECLARCSAQPLCRIAHHLPTAVAAGAKGSGDCYLGYYDLLPRPFDAVGWRSAVFER